MIATLLVLVFAWLVVRHLRRSRALARTAALVPGLRVRIPDAHRETL